MTKFENLKEIMTGMQLTEAQRMLDLKNRQLCKLLDISETTLCNWKAGRINIPKTVVLCIKYFRILQDRGEI